MLFAAILWSIVTEYAFQILVEMGFQMRAAIVSIIFRQVLIVGTFYLRQFIFYIVPKDWVN